MKKSYIWGATLFFAVLLLSLLLIKTAWQDNPEKANTDLGGAAKAESFVPASSPTISAQEKIMGKISAPVKILVYEDYSNVFSADTNESIKKLETEFGSKLVIAFRPYTIKGNPASVQSAMAVECAAEQEKWQEMREGIFQLVKESNLNIEAIKLLSVKIDLDQIKFAQCLTNTEKQGIMLQVADDAKQFSVYGAPTIFVANELIIGARPYDDYLDETGLKIEGLRSLVERQIK